jgi:hypothetical protein
MESGPVRAAELKAGEIAPAVDDADYAIVVYGMSEALPEEGPEAFARRHPAPGRWIGQL